MLLEQGATNPLDSDGDIDLLLDSWAQRIEKEDPTVLGPGVSHECLCHLVWPLANFRFHNCNEICNDQPARGVSQATAYVDAMETPLVTSSRPRTRSGPLAGGVGLWQEEQAFGSPPPDEL